MQLFYLCSFDGTFCLLCLGMPFKLNLGLAVSAIGEIGVTIDECGDGKVINAGLANELCS